MHTIATVFYPDMTVITLRFVLNMSFLVVLGAITHHARGATVSRRRWLVFAAPIVFLPIVTLGCAVVGVVPDWMNRQAWMSAFEVLPLGMIASRPPWEYEFDNAIVIFSYVAAGVGFSLQNLAINHAVFRLCGAVGLSIYLVLIVGIALEVAPFDHGLAEIFIASCVVAPGLSLYLFLRARRRSLAAHTSSTRGFEPLLS